MTTAVGKNSPIGNWLGGRTLMLQFGSEWLQTKPCDDHAPIYALQCLLCVNKNISNKFIEKVHGCFFYIFGG
jgi:hypothetical protein